MAPTVPKPAAPAKAADAKKPKIGKPRNYDLGNGVVRFSRSRVYHKKAIWKFKGKKTPKPVKVPRILTKEKKIGGDKNGGTRVVTLQKTKGFYPTQDKIQPRPSKTLFKNHKRTLRSTLTPGTVCILLAGPHKGKRVILMKQLASGLLLVNGPFRINACPLRRVHQRYVIGTQTKIDISSVKLPENMDDEYFRREKKKRAKKEEGDIFSTKKETYKVSAQRKADQKAVDKSLALVIRKHPDHKLMFAYLGTMWGLRSSQYPHRMVW